MRNKQKVFIIAEAGVNHNGKLSLALQMVDKAAACGCDAIKFQTFVAKNIISKFAAKADYQKKSTSPSQSQLEMVKKLELDRSSHQALIKRCQQKKIMFLSSGFDLESLDLLKQLKLKIFKIPSGEITNLPYLWKIGGFRKKIILSTGMSTIAEIKQALDILVKAGTKKSDITVLHCNTEYPTPFKDVNLRAMQTIGETFNCAVGYSDHTQGIEAAIAAVSLGACVIEKHFTLNRSLAGPDQAASLEPKELAAMVKAIRNIESALGNGIKQPSASEKKNIDIARKVIVASQTIKKNELFTQDNIALKRYGKGISGLKWYEVIGQKSSRNFKPDQAITV